MNLTFFILITAVGGSGGQLGRTLRWLKSLYQCTHIRLESSTAFEMEGSLQRSDLEESQEHNTEDSDVHDEERFVSEQKSSLITSSPLVVSNLWKIYPNGSFLTSLAQRTFSFCRCSKDIPSNNSKLPKAAVRGITFALRQGGEIFGLLGVNGVSILSSKDLYFVLSFILSQIFSNVSIRLENQLQWLCLLET